MKSQKLYPIYKILIFKSSFSIYPEIAINSPQEASKVSNVKQELQIVVENKHRTPFCRQQRQHLFQFKMILLYSIDLIHYKDRCWCVLFNLYSMNLSL